MATQQHQKIIRFWASLDLVVTGVLALPFTAKVFITVVYALNGMLGGADTAPEFAPIHWLFVCFTGGLGVLWALVRIYQPTVFNCKADAIGRAWMTLLLLYFVFVAGAPMVLLAFVATEAVGSVHQFIVIRRWSAS